SVEQAAKWQKELPRSDNPLFVSVNVSSKQLFRQDLIQEIRHIAGRAIVPDGVLRLEITESLVMENPEQATEMLDLLKSAGARLALDDFGSGYSSLTYLQRFPFDTIKIDSDLIQSSEDDGHGSTIVRSIVALSHELGKKVVAEGVEGPEDVGFLRSIGCEFAQGFYYGEPMGEREVTDLLRIVRKSERRLQRRGFFRTKKKEQVSSDQSASTQWPPPGAPQPAKEKKAPALPPKQTEKTDGGQRPVVEPQGLADAARAAGQSGSANGAAASNGQAPPGRGSPQFKSAGMRTRRRGDQPQEPIAPSRGPATNPQRAGQQAQTRPPARQRTQAPDPRRSSSPSQNAPPASKGNGAQRGQPPASLREQLERAGQEPAKSPQQQAAANGSLPHQQQSRQGQGNGRAGGPPPLPHQNQQGGRTAPSSHPANARSAPGEPTTRPHRQNGGEHHNGPNGGPPPLSSREPPRPANTKPMPDLSNLPPGIAASLAKLAGVEEK
ncbi:MAG: EAL domain-containing protein, partial [Pseudomonadota bacterium]